METGKQELWPFYTYVPQACMFISYSNTVPRGSVHTLGSIRSWGIPTHVAWLDLTKLTCIISMDIFKMCTVGT